MTEQLKKILEKLLHATQSLTEVEAVNDAKFLNVLLGIYRASFATLRDIYYLSGFEETGASVLDLSRKISEYSITVEYMIMKDKEKMAKTFQDYIWVQIKHDIDFFKSIGQNPEDNRELKIGAKAAKNEYNNLPKKMRDRKTWAGRSMDDMLESLHENKGLGDFDFTRIVQAYVEGSRCNHPNPFVVRHYLDTESAKAADDHYLKSAILMAIILHLRLTTRYIDEIRLITKDNKIHKDVADNVSKIYKQIEALK